VNKIDAPDVALVFWTQADDGTAFVMLRQLHPFFLPEQFYLFVVDLPVFNTDKFSDLAIVVTAILFG